MKVKFNQTLLADLILQGFKFLVLSRSGDEILIIPRREPSPLDQLNFLGLVQLKITETRVLEMIKHIDLIEEFQIFFLISQEYFESVTE